MPINRDKINKQLKTMHAINLKCLLKLNTSKYYLEHLRLFKLYTQHLSKSQVYIEENNVKQLYKRWENIFRKSKISEPKESTLNIFAYVLGTRKLSEVYKQYSLILSNDQIVQIQKLCELRLKKMPIQYIIGEWDFRDLTLKMASPVFIPRPETELLVDIVLNGIEQEKSYNVLEICCGSGAISLALLKSHPKIKITAIDQSLVACQLTTTNAGMHQLDERLTVRQYEVNDGNRLETFDETFDVIVSNPPYVPSAEVRSLQPEIHIYEDLAALDGGLDGMSLIIPILQIASEKLTTGGRLYLETDPTHPVLIEDICNKQSELKLRYLNTFKDFCNKDRFVVIERIV